MNTNVSINDEAWRCEHGLALVDAETECIERAYLDEMAATPPSSMSAEEISDKLADLDAVLDEMSVPHETNAEVINDEDEDEDDLILEDFVAGSETCTCGSDELFINDHLSHCDLWKNDFMVNGQAEWDNRLQAVYYNDDYIDEHFFGDDRLDSTTGEGGVTPIGTSTATTGTGTGTGATKAPNTWSTTYYSKCRHYQEEVKLPDDTLMYCSSHHSDRQQDPIPDLGIYLAGSWTPDTIAFHVGCPDYGVPKPAVWQVLHVAREGLRIAREGRRVEIGCVGGHGRTGLMLGIMHLLVVHEQGVQPSGPRSVKWVQKHYCSHAIESDVQEWYLDGIACELRGKPWPKKPEPKKYTSSSVAAAPWGYTGLSCPECKHTARHGAGDKFCRAYVAGSKLANFDCGCTHLHGFDEAGNQIAAPVGVTPVPATKTKTVYKADGTVDWEGSNRANGLVKWVAPKTGSIVWLRPKLIKPEKEDRCGAEAGKTYVSCELPKGHGGEYHQVISSESKVLRQWKEGDLYAPWVGDSSVPVMPFVPGQPNPYVFPDGTPVPPAEMAFPAPAVLQTKPPREGD